MKDITPISIAQDLARRELFAFSRRTMTDLYELTESRASLLLHQMEKSGLVARVERGKFLLLGLTPEKVLSNPLYIGCNLTTPAYVSFWSALHFHSFTEQVPHTVFLATTHQKKELSFREMHFKFVTLKPEAFFGYRRERLAELPVIVADEAKSILDSLSLPEYAGGLVEIAHALQNALAQGVLETPVLIEYARRLHHGSLSSRLGYLLECLEQPADDLDAAKGPVKLDPQGPAGGFFHQRWKLYINLDPADLFPAGVI